MIIEQGEQIRTPGEAPAEAPGHAPEEPHLRAILEATADGLLVVDGAGKVALSNRKFAEMWGIPEALMATRDDQRLLDFVTEQLVDPRQFIAKVEALYGSTSEDLDILLFKDGRVFERFSAPMHVPGGNPGRVWSFRDITARTRAESALRESEQRFRTLYNRTPVFLHSLDATGRVVEVSDYWLERMGHHREEVLGKSMRAFVPDDDWGLISQGLADTIGGFREIRDLQCQYVRGNGEQIDVLLTVVHGRGQKSVGELMLAVAVDVSAHRRMEEQLRHTQKLESLGLLAGGVAHDFNNLLVGIMGNADLMLDETASDSTARQYLEDIVQAAERAAGLSQQMLAYAGKGRFEVKSFDLGEVTADMSGLLVASLSKRVRLKHEPAGTVCAVRADVNQIRQIVMNLVTNAADALGEAGGDVLVSTGVRTLDRDGLARTWIDDGLVPGEYVFLRVEDKGCGMDAETRSRLFDPFFTSKGPGRGLGLAAVLGIIRGHLGAIDVQTAPGEGCCVTMWLPAVTGALDGVSSPVYGRAPEKEPRTDCRGTVLVVDDEESVRRMARRALEARGLRVLMAADGRAAVALHARHGSEIGAVLLDLTMPEMDGEETLRALRVADPDLPVLLSSGYSGDDALQRLNSQRPDGFVHKPYRVDDLWECVTGVLRQSGTETSGTPDAE